jgi:hypothetical protein
MSARIDSAEAYSLMAPASADALAASLNREEARENSAPDRLEYRAVHCPKGTGLSFIEVLDDSGAVIGNL